MAIRTLIVDDEPLGRERLERLLAMEQDVDVIATCPDGPQAVEAVKTLNPDLLFLDIQMPEMNGFEILKALGTDVPSAVVFVTAWDRYAVKAFEVQALDYLLKPFDRERLGQTLTRAREHLSAETQTPGPSKAEPPVPDGERRYLERLAIKSNGRIRLLRVSDIDYAEAAGNYIEVHVAGRCHLIRETMSNLEASLNPEHFQRIHRSVIVHLDRIAEIQTGSHGELGVVLEDGTRLSLSRSYRERLLSRWGS